MAPTTSGPSVFTLSLLQKVLKPPALPDFRFSCFPDFRLPLLQCENPPHHPSSTIDVVTSRRRPTVSIFSRFARQLLSTLFEGGNRTLPSLSPPPPSSSSQSLSIGVAGFRLCRKTLSTSPHLRSQRGDFVVNRRFSVNNIRGDCRGDICLFISRNRISSKTLQSWKQSQHTPPPALQAKAFTSPASLSFPGGHGEITPPSSDKDGYSQASDKNGQQLGGNATSNGVTPATPAEDAGCGIGCQWNIVATVNLDCRLDLKTIALHARNAEYNPKVCKHFVAHDYELTSLAFCCCHHAHSRSEDDCTHLCIGQDGRHRRQVRG
ncbi:hypothetical protein MRB53_040116 [Persea americana]|nr:hypothetical protein MRB53_040116 [Persea americana]